MGKTKQAWADALATSIRLDIDEIGIAERRLADRLGISKSSLNDLKNAKYTSRGPHHSTLRRLAEANIWSSRTLRAIDVLLTYDDLAFERRVPDVSILEGGPQNRSGSRFAAE